MSKDTAELAGYLLLLGLGLAVVFALAIPQQGSRTNNRGLFSS